MEKRESFVYKLIVIGSLITGIALNIVNTKSLISILSYYTLQSNIFCLIVFIGIIISILAKKKYRKNEVYYFIKGAITIAIFITGIVYLIALLPNNFQMEFSTTSIEKILANIFVHIISPVLVILDYLIFDTKGKFKIWYPLGWLFLPLNYVIYVYTYSANGGRFFGIGGSKYFAYIFLDYNQIGYSGVVKCLSIMAATIIFSSYILIYIDRKCRKKH